MTIKKNGFERNMILYVSIILIVLIVYSGISYYNTVRIAREQLDLTNKAVLRQVKSNTETSLYNIERLSFRLVQDNLVNSFVDEKVADSFSKFKLQEMLNSSIISDDFIDSIYIYSEASGEVITTSTFCNIENLHDISWLEEYKNLNQPYIVFSRYIDNGKGKGEELVLTLVRNISMFTGGNSKGAVVVNMNTSVFKQAFDTNDMESVLSVCVTDEDDKVLYHSNNKEYVLDKKTFAPETKETENIYQSKIDGAKNTVYYDYSKMLGLQYYILAPRFSSMIQVYILGFFLILMLAIVIAFTIIAVKRINQKTFKPLEGFVYGILEHIKENYKNVNVEDQYDYNNLENIYQIIKENDQNMKQQISSSLPAMQWRVMMGILTGETTDYESVSSYLEVLNVELYPQNYIVMITEIDYRNDLINTLPSNTLSVYVETIFCEIEKIVDGTSIKILSMKSLDDKIITIFSFAKDDIESNINQVLSYANILQFNIENLLKITISIGIGGIYADMSNIHNSYKEAKYALNYKFLSGNNAIISIEDIMAHSDDFEDIINKIEQLKNQNIDEIKISVEKIFKEISSSRITPNVFDQLAMQIVINIFVNDDIAVIKDKVLERTEYGKIYYKISQFETMNDTKKYIMQFIYDIKCELDNHIQGIQKNKVVYTIIDYIDQHYQDPNLSLSYMAEKLGCSTAHISRVFKSTTNINFIDYLIDIRMKKAKELLENSNKKISDIGIEVGYLGANSFMRIFKSYVGKTPSEFRKKKQETTSN